MQLPEKLMTFSEIFSPLLKCSSDFEHSEKKDDIHSQCISKVIECERYG